MTERDILLVKIQETKAAMETAGTIHRQDLHRHIKRLIRQLRQYDRSH